jgi:hypothetical protein
MFILLLGLPTQIRTFNTTTHLAFGVKRFFQRTTQECVHAVLSDENLARYVLADELITA